MWSWCTTTDAVRMSTRVSILVWLVVTAIVGGYGVYRFRSQDQTLYLPGTTSHGHYQIEMACNQCHTPFGGVSNDACLKCHGAAREAADSHPKTKFDDPRNAAQLAKMDATKCVTCHAEHWPAGTHREGYSMPVDFCVECHADVGKERPSHTGMAFSSCSDTGCHNYHDNRSLWEDYLKQHLGEPPTLAEAHVPVRGPKPDAEHPNKLIAKDADTPPTVAVAAVLVNDWAASAHARGGVNCTGCHGGIASPWVKTPSMNVCERCHEDQGHGIRQGRHGMRLAVGFEAMKPGAARLPMKPESAERQIGCSSCHSAHSYDARMAAAGSCPTCHDDEHTRNYDRSAHYKTWLAEATGKAPPGTGVSCATCHLPRRKNPSNGLILVDHNQNSNLRPTDKMIRDVCVNCHGAAFSLDAMADADLVRQNFAGRPAKHISTMDMVEKREAGRKK